MAAAVSFPSREALFNMISNLKDTICPVELAPLYDAVSLSPCAHKVNETVARQLFGGVGVDGFCEEEAQKCPVCRTVVIGYSPDHAVRALAHHLRGLIGAILCQAAEAGEIKCVDILKKECDQDDIRNAFFKAAESGQVKVIESLLEGASGDLLRGEKVLLPQGLVKAIQNKRDNVVLKLFPLCSLEAQLIAFNLLNSRVDITWLQRETASEILHSLLTAPEDAFKGKIFQAIQMVFLRAMAANDTEFLEVILTSEKKNALLEQGMGSKTSILAEGLRWGKDFRSKEAVEYLLSSELGKAHLDRPQHPTFCLSAIYGLVIAFFHDIFQALASFFKRFQ